MSGRVRGRDRDRLLPVTCTPPSVGPPLLACLPKALQQSRHSPWQPAKRRRGRCPNRAQIVAVALRVGSLENAVNHGRLSVKTIGVPGIRTELPLDRRLDALLAR